MTENKYRILTIYSNESILDFSSNDYLLLGSKYNIEAMDFAREIGKEYGVASTGSRLLSGNNAFIMDFETQIAKDKYTEKALIFNSGYQANISVLSALCDSKVLGEQAEIYFDKSNHSSLYQGVFLSKSELIRYRHNDLNELEQLLEKRKHTNKPKFIVSETVFGMDGDIANIAKLIELSTQYNALLYLDEAHATGLYGKNGYGLCGDYINCGEISNEEISNEDRTCKSPTHKNPIKNSLNSISNSINSTNLVIMGTFSKAIGSSGAYIASNEIVINYLINNCSGFIYSTAPSPISTAISKFNWNKIKTAKMSMQRIELRQKSNYLRKKLSDCKIEFHESNTNIILIACKDSEHCLKVRNYLSSKNISVSAIRPPTASTARIRIALNVGHTLKEIDKLIDVLVGVMH